MNAEEAEKHPHVEAGLKWFSRSAKLAIGVAFVAAKSGVYALRRGIEVAEELGDEIVAQVAELDGKPPFSENPEAGLPDPDAPFDALNRP